MRTPSLAASLLLSARGKDARSDRRWRSSVWGGMWLRSDNQTISGFAAATRSGPMGVRQGRRAARICCWVYLRQP